MIARLTDLLSKSRTRGKLTVVLDLFICGVPKGGTTALDRTLLDHVAIDITGVNDLHFFDDESSPYDTRASRHWHALIRMPEGVSLVAATIASLRRGNFSVARGWRPRRRAGESELIEAAADRPVGVRFPDSRTASKLGATNTPTAQPQTTTPPTSRVSFRRIASAKSANVAHLTANAPGPPITSSA